jgi:hypothetical protein
MILSRALRYILAVASALDSIFGWLACETVGSFGGGEPARAYKCARCGARVWR